MWWSRAHEARAGEAEQNLYFLLSLLVVGCDERGVKVVIKWQEVIAVVGNGRPNALTYIKYPTHIYKGCLIRLSYNAFATRK